jgi:dienelactone hydrolase
MIRLLLLAVAALMPAVAFAEQQTGPVDYKSQGTVLEGYVAFNKGPGGKRPGVLVVPDWTGVSDHYKKIAGRLADLGYVAFVADIYGKGVRPKNPQEAAAEANKYKSDRPLMRQRIAAALDEFKKNPNVDPNRIAAMGYCFGGTVVLELARSGAPVIGVVSFHGGLDTPTPEDAKNIKGKVLVLHGADDPLVPPQQVAAFQDEMRKAGVDWQMVFYGDAVHAFTTPAAGTDKSKGIAYNEKADKRSWEAMKSFFKEIFGGNGKH